MNKKMIFIFSVLILLFFSLGLFAQSSMKIKPILGKHSYALESTDVGYGVTKHSLCLERLGGNITELYLPSDIPLTVDAVPFNEPEQSGKLKINSQQTADGFLFIANGPQGNNFHLHLKKSASENSNYSIEINLTQGNKYEFSVGYLPGGYLIIKGQSGDYYEMLDAVSSNTYFLEALSLLDDEFGKYSGNSQLEWWAQAAVGLFQDLVDVEAISSIPSAQMTSCSTEFFEGVSNEYYSFLPIYWFYGGQGYIQILFPTQFMLLRVSEGATVGLYTTSGSYLNCAYGKCANLPSAGEQGICIMECMGSGDGDGDGGGGGFGGCDECMKECQDKYDQDMRTCKLMAAGAARTVCEEQAKRKFENCKILCAADYPGDCPFFLPYEPPQIPVPY